MNATEDRTNPFLTCCIDERRHKEKREEHEEDRHELPGAAGAQVRLQPEAVTVAAGALAGAGWSLGCSMDNSTVQGMTRGMVDTGHHSRAVAGQGSSER